MPAGYPQHVPSGGLRSTTGYLHSKGAVVMSLSGGGSTVGSYYFQDGSTTGTPKYTIRHPAAQTVPVNFPEGLVFSSKIHVTITGSNKKIATARFYKLPSRTGA